jgi:aspartyl-tRNA(Asn)/glutamyl-tRNA(Gln) amidotransferase subunit A
LVAYSSSLDQIGPIARTAKDLELVYRVIGGQDHRDSTSLPLPSMRPTLNAPDRIGVPSASFLSVCEPTVIEAFDRLKKSLASSGAELVEVELPGSDAVIAAYYVIALGEASSNLARYDGVRFGTRPQAAFFETRIEAFHTSVRGQFGEEVRHRLLMGAHVLSSGYREDLYLRACRMRRKVFQDFESLFSKVNFIVSPVSTNFISI